MLFSLTLTLTLYPHPDPLPEYRERGSKEKSDILGIKKENCFLKSLLLPTGKDSITEPSAGEG